MIVSRRSSAPAKRSAHRGRSAAFANSLKVTPSASATRPIIPHDGLRPPLSSRDTQVGCTLAAWATCSWVICLLALNFLTAFPKATWGSWRGGIGRTLYDLPSPVYSKFA